MNLSLRVYKVEFRNTSDVFLVQDFDDFAKLLKFWDCEVVKITRTSGNKGAFKAISKRDLNSFTDWHTELNLLLKKSKII